MLAAIFANGRAGWPAVSGIDWCGQHQPLAADPLSERVEMVSQATGQFAGNPAAIYPEVVKGESIRRLDTSRAACVHAGASCFTRAYQVGTQAFSTA